MKKVSIILCGCAALLLTASGCATKSHYVDAQDTTSAVLNNTRMSQADWVIVTKKMGEALLTSSNFQEYLDAYKIDAEKALKKEEAAGKEISALAKKNAMKPLLMLSAIQNNTSEHINSTVLTEQLREVLFNSGKVRFTTYAAGAGQNIDAATAQARDLKNDPNVKKSAASTKKGKVNVYDLSLSGSITKQTAQDGRDNEISYMFSLTLTDNVTGEGVWAATKEIKRQYTQGGFGW